MEIKYDRQSRIPNWNQDLLKNASIAVVGAGALGNHVCIGLMGLGIGTIKIFDFDRIEPHNLNRQSLFCETDIGENKAECLAKRLEERNSNILILGINEKIDEENIDEIFINIDVIIDCVDRIYVKKLLNFYGIRNNIPLIHGGISWCGGQTGVLTRETPCINCIYPESIQEEEKNIITSCIQKPEASVIYISQITAGLMVEAVRKVLLPLPTDPINKIKLQKFDLRLDKPFYEEKFYRKPNCECKEILNNIAPEILKKEQKNRTEINKLEEIEIKSIISTENKL